MNTPKLDTLVELSLSQCASLNDFRQKREQLERIFWAYGPALVAVLKQLLRSVNDNQLLEAEAKAEQLLRQLDQEATCQT